MRLSIALFAFALAAQPAWSEGAQIEQPPAALAQEEAVPAELLVRFEDGVSESRIDEINARLGVSIIGRMQGGKLLQIAVPDPELVDSVMAIYRATPGVRYAEPNFAVRALEGVPTPDAPSIQTDAPAQ